MNILIVWCVIIAYVLILCKCHDQIYEGLHTPRLYTIILMLAFCFGYAAANIDNQIENRTEVANE